MLPVFALMSRGQNNARRAAVGMQTGMLNLMRSDKRMQLERAYGISLMDKQTGRLKSQKEILLILAKKADEYNLQGRFSEFQNTLRGATGMWAINSFIAGISQLRESMGQYFPEAGGSMAKTLELIYQGVKDNEGALQRMADLAVETVIRRVQQLSDALKNLSINAFLPLIPVIEKAVQALSGIVSWIAALFSDFPYVSKLLSVLAGAFFATATIMVLFIGSLLVAKAWSMLLAKGVEILGDKTLATAKDAIIGGMGWVTWTKKVLTATKAGGGLVVVMKALKTGIKGIIGSFLGPVGMLMSLITMLELIPLVWPIVKNWFGMGSDDMKSKQGKVTNSVDAASKMLDKQTQFGDSLTWSLDALERSVRTWDAALKSQLPKLSKDAVKTVDTQVEGLITGGAIKGEYEQNLARQQMANIKYMLQNPAAMRDPADAKNAMESVAVLRNLLVGTGKTDKKTVDDNMKAIGDALKGFMDDSEALARTLVAFDVGGIRTKGLEESETKLQDAERSVDPKRAIPMLQKQFSQLLRNVEADKRIGEDERIVILADIRNAYTNELEMRRKQVDSRYTTFKDFVSAKENPAAFLKEAIEKTGFDLKTKEGKEQYEEHAAAEQRKNPLYDINVTQNEILKDIRTAIRRLSPVAISTNPVTTFENISEADTEAKGEIQGAGE
jgi:hypothetical protein